MTGLLGVLAHPYFAIHEQMGMAMASYADQILLNQLPFSPDLFGMETVAPSYVSMQGADHTDPEDSAAIPEQGGLIAMIPVKGTMLADDQPCGPVGMETIAGWVRAAADAENIKGIMMVYQSPGGQLLGSAGLSQALTYAREQKPLLSYVSGMACSQAYRMAAEGHEIMMDSALCEVGSIGVMLNYLDVSERMKTEGMRNVQIVSTLSPNKNKYKLQGATEEDAALIQADLLDPRAAIFQAEIQALRPGIAPEAMDGDVFLAEQAISLGLADGIGTMQDALQWFEQEAEDKSSEKNNTMFGKKTVNQEAFAQLIADHAQALEDQATNLKATHDGEYAQLKADLQGVIDNMTAEADRKKVEAQTQADLLTAAQQEIAQLQASTVNEVADDDGIEADATADATDESAAPPKPAWAGFGNEYLQNRP